MKPAIKPIIKFIVIAVIPIFMICRPTDGIDVRHEKTTWKVNASYLYRIFHKDTIEANKTFENKIIEVSGIISAVDQTKEGEIQIALETKNQMGQILCSLESRNPSQLETLRIGQAISIKGICKGYNKDVIIANGLIIKST